MDPEVTEMREEEWKKGHWKPSVVGGLCRACKGVRTRALSYTDSSCLTTLYDLTCLS